MNIILVSNKMAKAKTLSVLQTSLLVGALILVPVMLTLLFLTPPSNIKEQGMKALLPPHLKSTIINSQVHLDAYAKELGELQARMMRLDAQSQRLAKLAGEKDKQAPNANAKPASTQLEGRGGPLILARPMTELDLQKAIAKLTDAVDERDDSLSGIEAKILQQSVLKEMLPNGAPVAVAFNSSSYGWRIDPFTGGRAFHEGLDFPANMGTPIRAAADGIVSFAEHTPDYGNIVKISHGSGLETRYAHASKLLVHAGDRVVKGQEVAEIGSSGRSTGPHLHYEIRLNGESLDPRKYLGS